MEENYQNNYDSESANYSNADLLNQAQPPASSPQYDRVIQEEKVANFISQTSPYKSLSKIDWVLKGYVFDEGEKEWIKVAQGIPDKIRMDFLQVMTPHLTEDVRMTRLDERTINSIMEFAIEWTIDYLDIVADQYYWDSENQVFKEFKEKEINKKYNFDYFDGYVLEGANQLNQIHQTLSEEQMTKIALMMWSALFYTLSRSLNGVERDKMYGVLKLGDDFSNYAKQEEKKSILSSILPWK